MAGEHTTARQTVAIRFGPFEFDESRHELRRQGRPVRLHLQPAKVLALLLREAGRIVPREEIRQRVWDDETHVSFDQGINHCIRQLRSALGDSARDAVYIETLPRHGYRFVAPVHEDEAVAPPAPPPADAGVHHRVRSAGLLLGVAAAVLLTLGGYRLLDTARTTADSRPPVIVVLPFENLGGDDDSTLGDALTEELISRLGQRYPRSLGVIARTSAMHYKGTTLPVSRIADDLGADYLLESSVRRDGARVRISTQLIRAADQVHLWAANYERKLADLIDFQVEVSDKIAEALVLKLLPEERDRRIEHAVTRPEAYDTYLAALGVQVTSREAVFERLERFQEAVEADPGFAPAWVGLAEAWSFQPLDDEERWERIKEAAQRALALDETQVEANVVLSKVLFYHDWEFERARTALEAAVRQRPGYAEAWHALASYHSIRGEHDEAIALVRRALSLDPKSPEVLSDLGWFSYFGRRYDEAIEYSEITLETFPRSYWSHRCILFSRLQQGDLAGAARQAEREMRLADPDPFAGEREVEGARDAARILNAYWRWDRTRKQAAADRGWDVPSNIAEIDVWEGDYEAALDRLEQSMRMRIGWTLPFLRVAPWADPLRADPRFDALVAAIDPGSGSVEARLARP